MLLYLAFGLPALLAVTHLILTVPAWLYVASVRRGKSAPPTFKGRVAVFVPCKGLELEFESNLEAVLSQDRADYSVTFIVERVGDPAHAAIRQVAARHPHASIVVAGLAENCGQKNHNLLKGIAARLGDADALVFCDSDVRPDRGWLNRLVGPLANAATPVTTGFRWIKPAQGSTFGAYMHAIFNSYMSTMIANKAWASVWGGSMAIRRDFWDRYDVGESWRRTVVDDMTVSAILLEQRLQRVYVLSCITPTDEAIPGLADAMNWFTRQILYVRYYLYPIWLLILAIWIPTGLAPVISVALLAWSWHTGSVLALQAGLASAALVVLVGACLLVVRSLGSPNFPVWMWVVLTPLVLPVGAWAIIASATARNLRWRNVVYEIGARGEVLSISREPVPSASLPEPQGEFSSSSSFTSE